MSGISDRAKTFLFDLLNTPSPSGFEARGQRKWIDYVRESADSVETDAYGSAWATRLGAAGEEAPSVMLEAHADEIGYMINFVSEEGFLHVVRIGGSDRATSRGKRVHVLGDNGRVSGVIGNTAIHIRKDKDKVPEVHELFVDVGAADRDAVAALGIRVGHPVVFMDSVEELMPGRLTGRALDNRIGGFIIAQVLHRLAARKERAAATVHVANCVQEEIGGHGARMLAYRLHPSVAVVLDVTHATDSPGIDKTKFGDVKLGQGPSVTHGHANHTRVIDRLVEVAEGGEIPVQHEAIAGFTGTDTDDIFIAKTGVPSALVSLPMRYMHSTVETVDLEDVERCIDLLSAFVIAVGAGERFDAVV